MDSYVYQSSKSFEKNNLEQQHSGSNTVASVYTNDCVDYDLGVYYYYIEFDNTILLSAVVATSSNK